ncbi:MAG TPA: zinc ribbon domain-containing protein [bacterium]|nr:zinc ribbon domain-containing protein [bacterium]
MALEIESELAEAGSKATDSFPCSVCGGQLTFDPGSSQLKCPYCGSLQQVPESAEAKVIEHDLETYLKERSTQSWGLEMAELRCEGCGATTETSDKFTSMNCPFCDKPLVVSDAHRPEDFIRPESVLPFMIDAGKMTDSLRSWLGRRWFAPNDLKNYWEKGKVRGIYLPFWTFDAQTSTKWHGDAGFYYYERQGDRRVQKVRWEYREGTREDAFDDTLVPASGGVDVHKLRALQPFRTQEVKPYRSEFLAGYLCERYALGPREAWQQAENQMLAQIKTNCIRDMRADTHKNLIVSSKFRDIKIKHVLLPIYIGHYHYRGKDYAFHANGQTGKIEGQSPISWIKILLAILAIIALLVIFGYVGE